MLNDKKCRKRFALAGVSLIALSAAGTGAAAQGGPTIEEIVVTAQKRAQSINSIGVTASAFDGDGLKEAGIDSPVDLGAFVPGLMTVNATSGGTPIFAIRGIGLDDFSPNNSSGVGVYTNEVFASNPAFLNGLLFDLDRVEVLKGPQGTLYGFNTTGGAINFITNKPTDEVEAYFNVGVGNYGRVEVAGAVGGPLSDTVRGRIAFSLNRSDGWQDDPATGREFGGDDKAGLRGMLEFDVGETASVLFDVHYVNDQSTPISPQAQGNGDFFGDASFDALNSPTDPRQVSVGDLDVRRDEEGFGGSMSINSSFDFAEFISITAYDEYDRFVVDNYGGSPAATLDFIQDDKLKQFSQEFRLVSNSDGPISWVAGVNYANFEVDVVDLFDDSFFLTDSAAVTFVLDPADIAAAGDDELIASYVQESTSWGAYLHTEMEVGEDITLIAGARYSMDERTFSGASVNQSFGDIYPIVALDDEDEEGKVNWKIGIDWEPTDDTLFYANVATSYKAGTYYGAPVLDDAAWSFIEPEDVISYEAGVKQTLLDGAMQINAAVFQLNYDDRQSLVTFVADDFSDLLLIPIVDTTLINVPESVSEGFEFDVRWLPAEGWDITAGFAYLNAEIEQGPTAAIRGIALDPSVNDLATGDLDFSGFIDGPEVGFVDALGTEVVGRLSQAPEISYHIQAAYEQVLKNEMIVRYQISYSYADEQIAQLSDPNAEYGPVKSLNAQLSLVDDNNGWNLAIWGRNLTDQDAETYAFSGFAGRAVYRQKPLEFGLRFGRVF